MKWERLLTIERLNGQPHESLNDYDVRSEFQRDIDRIVFSSAFRRLQDKTQVLPFPGSDFIHTRLTHSLEVASIGRSLGKLIGNFVIEKNEISTDKVTADDFGNITVAACLAHDIGNPPFGHSGEDAIGKAFGKIFSKWKTEKDQRLLSVIDKDKDFTCFEGNAAGFRILTNDHPSGVLGGLRLTYATLGAFSKYPTESGNVTLNELGRSIKNRRSLKKYGVFKEEKEVFLKVAQKLGLLNLSSEPNSIAFCRHPLAFAVEAADTFTYKIIDLEDAHKLGFVSTQDAQDLFMEIIRISPDRRCQADDWRSLATVDEKIGALRSKALNSLIHEAFIVFKQNYEEIMTGMFDSELADVIPSSEHLSNIQRITSEKFYRHTLVIDVELSGFEVFDGLINLFVDAINSQNDSQSKKLLLKLPDYIRAPLQDNNVALYKKLLLITDYTSRMTDSFAIDLYRKLKGIELSNY